MIPGWPAMAASARSLGRLDAADRLAELVLKNGGREQVGLPPFHSWHGD